MNIQSISIVPETVGCDALCKYCIARMPPPAGKRQKVKLTHLDEALVYAKSGGHSRLLSQAREKPSCPTGVL